jgi:hypothetical protein
MMKLVNIETIIIHVIVLTIYDDTQLTYLHFLNLNVIMESQ